MAGRFIPDRGDIVWLQFNPQAGQEQSGLRPALVVSPRSYNKAVGLAVCCPVTSRVKGYPFEVVLPQGLEAQGAVLADQVKILDWKARNARLYCVAPDDVVAEVAAKIAALLEAD